MLDVVVRPDRRWDWKDEDEFAARTGDPDYFDRVTAAARERPEHGPGEQGAALYRAIAVPCRQPEHATVERPVHVFRSVLVAV